jgi:hypothetical protein
MTASSRPPRLTLAAHAARLLAGTGLSSEDAARAAAGDPGLAVPPGAEAAVQALRDGWAAAGPYAAGLYAEPEAGGPA